MALPKIKNFEDYDQYITEPDYTTSAQAQEYFKNQRDLLGAVIVSYWQPETTYPNGYIVQSDSMPNGAEAVCVAVSGGKTGNVEPEWGEIGGGNISDGTCFWHLRHKVATVNGLEPDNKGNIQIPVMTGSNGNTVGKDGLVPAPPVTEEEKFLSNDGTWIEAGKVKSVNGKTGDVVVDLPVGHMYWSVEPNVPAGRLPASGALYNRPLYQNLYNWADERGLVKTESEWQAIASANDGNCAYYSSGDGSTTFRVPKLPTTIASDVPSEVPVVGNGMALGLTDGTNYASPRMSSGADGLVWHSGLYGASVGTSSTTTDTKTNKAIGLTTDTSKSGIVAKTSATKITGQWLIVAFGVAHNIGEADVANVMQAVETAQTSIQTVDNKITGISDYIIESYRNGTEWYEVYKSGKIRQGGRFAMTGEWIPCTFLKPFENTDYTLNVTSGAGTGENDSKNNDSRTCKLTATGFYVYSQHKYSDWVAEGQGA